MKTLSESILMNLKESIDVSAFDVYSDSPFMKIVCDIAGCDPSEVEECIGYVFNDSEPEDFILVMNDGTARLVGTSNGGKAVKLSDKQTAISVLFSDGANYNI